MRAFVRSTYGLILAGALAVAGLGGCSEEDAPDARIIPHFPDAPPPATPDAPPPMPDAP